MLRDDKTEVLVVGAGPVGMMTALLLSKQGIDVRIIDQETRTAAHSYACALHPAALRLLDQLGLAKTVIERGRRIDSLAFYQGASQRASIKLADLPGPYPFMVVLPQGDLEDLLEQKLKNESHIPIHWSHRLSELQTQGATVLASIDKLAETAKGYIVPEWEWTVEKTVHTTAAFVVGADGHSSHVRQCLGIDYESLTPPELFVVYEFETAAELGNEVRVVLDKAATSVMWPLPGKTCRWSFQWIEKEKPTEIRSKDRSSVVIVEPAVDEGTRQNAQKLLHDRAPWFTGSVDELDWSTDVQFEHRLAKQFGQGRCWLVGDAAHQTSPVGMQSMNLGLCEAENLTGILRKILREQASLDLLESYHSQRRDEWQRLLGLKGGLKATPKTNAWVKERLAKILPCLPASGEDLKRLAGQLALEV